MYGFIIVFATLACFLGAYWVGTHPNPRYIDESYGVSAALFFAGVLIVFGVVDRWFHKK